MSKKLVVLIILTLINGCIFEEEKDMINVTKIELLNDTIVLHVENLTAYPLRIENIYYKINNKEIEVLEEIIEIPNLGGRAYRIYIPYIIEPPFELCIKYRGGALWNKYKYIIKIEKLGSGI